MSGLFIAFEGIDKSGKDTQVDLLAKYLITSGMDVVTIDFPCYDTPSGQAIEAILSGIHPLTVDNNPMEVQALYMINRYEQQDRIIQALMEGKTVIANRYLYSSMVYGQFGGVDTRWMEAAQTAMVQPDITFLLDIDMDTYHKRCQGQTLDSFEEKAEFIEAARKIYLGYGKHLGWFIVDGKNEEPRVHEQIVASYKEILKLREEVEDEGFDQH